LRNTIFGAARNHLGLGAASQHRVLRLAGDETNDVGHFPRRANFIGRPFTEAHIPHLARFDDIGEGPHSFFERRFGIVAMALIEIDIVGSQTIERSIELLEDLRAR